MLNKWKKDVPEKEAMTAEQIREMRENERIDSIYREESVTQKRFKLVLVYGMGVLFGAVLLAGLFGFQCLSSFLCVNAYPFLWMVDDSSGFLMEMLGKLLQLLLVGVVIMLFGFFMEINFSPFGRDAEDWSKAVKICLIVAVSADVLFLLKARLFSEAAATANGTLISQVPYYITKLLLVPIANVLLYLVVPSAIIKSLLTLIAESQAQVELPLILITTVMLTLGQLGMSAVGIAHADVFIILYALIQSAVCSVIYHKTDVIWAPILTYSGVTALYYGLSWLLYLI